MNSIKILAQFLYILLFFCGFSVKCFPVNIPQKVVISGYILDSNREPIVDANIIYESNYSYTDDNGYFKIIVKSGSIEFSVNHIKYQIKTIKIQALEKDTICYVHLVEKDNIIDEIVVVSEGNEKAHILSEVGTFSIDQATLKKIPAILGEIDVIKAFHTQPGVSGGAEGFAGMFVRGGTGDDNLFVLDGNALYQVSHLGGFFSAFNSAVIKDVKLYKASFPAKFGGRLSSVVDIKTKTNNMTEKQGVVSLGLTSGSIYYEAPIIENRTSFNVGLRRSWLELLSIPALAIKNRNYKDEGEKTIGRYSFLDLNAKINHKFNDKSYAFISFYFGKDFLKFGKEKYALMDDLSDVDENKLNWNNSLLSLGWNYTISNKADVVFKASYMGYKSNMTREVIEKDNQDLDRFVENITNKTTKNGIEDYCFSVDFNSEFLDHHHFNSGINYVYHSFHPEFSKSYYNDNLLKADSSRIIRTIEAHELSLYAEDEWDMFSFMRMNIGGRFNMFKVKGKTYYDLEPRISLRFLLKPTLSLKAAYSEMSQFSQQISDSYINLPTDFWLPISKNRKPLRSKQYSLGFYYAYQQSYELSIEGYYKKMRNVSEYKDGYELLSGLADWEEKLVTGEGQSYGVDLMISKSKGDIYGWIGYGLMWADRKYSTVNNGNWFPARYDNRHKINIVCLYKPDKHIELNATWTYLTGNRATIALQSYQKPISGGFPPILAPSDPNENPIIDYVDNKNNVRLPAYHRLDLGANFFRPKKNGKMGIWTVSLYNAYSRMNPISISKKTMGSIDNEKHIFQTMSLFPVIPSISYTYKF